MAAYESVSVCAKMGLWIEVGEVVRAQRRRQNGVDWMNRWLTRTATGLTGIPPNSFGKSCS